MGTDDLERDDIGRQQQQWCTRPPSLSKPPATIDRASTSKGNAPARPEFLTLDEVLKLGFTTPRLVDLAADGTLHVYARGARFAVRAIDRSTPTAYPTGTILLGAAQAAHVLARIPFDETSVGSHWEELDVVVTPANIRFLAKEIYDLVRQARSSTTINSSKEMSYLKLIAALLANAQIDPRKRGTAVVLSTMIKDQFPGFSLDETTIRDIINKINSMTQ